MNGRWIPGFLLLVVWLPCPAQEAPRGARPAPLEPEEKALRLLEAHRAGEREIFEALADDRLPDPYKVADALLGMHLEHVRACKEEDSTFLAAAEALAGRLAGEPLFSRLPGLVKEWRRWDGPGRERVLALQQIVKEAREPSKADDFLGVLAIFERGKRLALEGAATIPGTRLLAKGTRALYCLGRCEEAQALIEPLSSAAHALGWKAMQATALNLQGVIRSARKEHTEAVALWREELSLREALGDPTSLVNCLQNLGIVLARDLKEPRKAIPFLERCLAMRVDAHQAGEQAVVLGYLGQALGSVGEHARAESTLRSGIGKALEAGLLKTAVTQMLTLRGPLVALGRVQEVPALLEKAHGVACRLEDKKLISTVVHQFGDFYCHFGDFGRALAWFERHLALVEEMGDSALLASSLGNLGLALEQLGRLKEALEALERALALHRASGNREGCGTVLDTLGAVLGRLGHHDRAIECLEEAARICEEGGDPARLAMAYCSLGLALDEMKRFPEARDSYEKALAQASKTGHRQQEAVLLGNLAHVEKALGRREEAISCFSRALALFRAIGDRVHEAIILDALACLRAESGEYEEAIPILEESCSLFERLGSWLHAATSLSSLSRACLRAGRMEQALEASLEAVELRLRQTHGLGEMDALNLRRQTRSSAVIGLEAALALLRDAEEEDHGLASKAFFLLEIGKPLLLAEILEDPEGLLLGRVSPELLSAETKAANLVRNLQRELARLSRRNDVSPDPLARSRESLEAAYKSLEIAIGRIERANRSAAGEAMFRPASLDSVRAALPEDTALVLFLQGTRLSKVVLSVRRESIAYKEIPFDESWASRLDEFTRLLAIPGSDTVETASALYDLLIRPFESHLSGVERLLLSPDEDLVFLPFEALLRAGDDRPGRLMERWEVAYVPSGTIYAALKASKLKGQGLLALGDPLYPGENPDSERPLNLAALTRGLAALPRLPGTGQEIRAIRDHFQGEPVTLLLREDASRENLLARLNALEGPLSTLHLACHGVVDPEHPRLTGLVLAHGEVLTLDDIYRLRLQADLVVLSACETGKGRLAQGEGVLGLVRGFFLAGAPRVIVSSWKVQDQGTKEFFGSFYRHLREKGLTPAAALRAAKLERLRRDGAAAHPSQWAGFALWGRED